MKVAIMQPYFLPYIGYFQLINAVDKFVFYDDVNFIKKGWIHRNNLLVNGEAFLFSIPCKAISQNRHINQIELDFDSKSKDKFLKRIELAYKKAPYFDMVYKEIEQLVLKSNASTISTFAIDSVKIVCDYLDIKIQFVISSNGHSESQGEPKQMRLINVAKKENAETYINPIGGLDLYSKEDFKKSGLELRFLSPEPIQYRQFGNDFVSNLSMVDVLMFNDKQTINKFLASYKLI